MTDAELDRLLALAAAEVSPLSPRFLDDALTRALAEQPGAAVALPAVTAAAAAAGAGMAVPAAVRADGRSRRLRLPFARAAGNGRGNGTGNGHGTGRLGAGMGAALAGLALVALLGGVVGYADPGSVTEVLLAWPDPGFELVPAIEPFLVET